MPRLVSSPQCGERDKVVAVREARAHDISFVSVGAHSLEEPQRQFHFPALYTPYVRFTPEEMPAIGLAHPITQFWLYKPVLPAFVLSCRERVVMKSGFQRKPFGQPYFHAEIGRGEHACKQIAFHGNVFALPSCRREAITALPGAPRSICSFSFSTVFSPAISPTCLLLAGMSRSPGVLLRGSAQSFRIECRIFYKIAFPSDYCHLLE